MGLSLAPVNCILRSVFRIFRTTSWVLRSRCQTPLCLSAKHARASPARHVCLNLPTHNRLFVEAEPLGSELCDAIDAGEVKAGADNKLQGRLLADEHGWDVSEARKIWAFGPDGTGPNMFVDTT